MSANQLAVISSFFLACAGSQRNGVIFPIAVDAMANELHLSQRCYTAMLGPTFFSA
jgi:hypothetical protein